VRAFDSVWLSPYSAADGSLDKNSGKLDDNWNQPTSSLQFSNVFFTNAMN
jgi:hypothetical protein